LLNPVIAARQTRVHSTLIGTRTTIPSGDNTNLNWNSVNHFKDWAARITLTGILSSSGETSTKMHFLHNPAVLFETQLVRIGWDIDLEQSVALASSLRGVTETNYSEHLVGFRQ
jgi:hypothetical protein